MRIILFILLFLAFGYSLGLVLANDTPVAVNLLFSNAPPRNLGLWLILSIILGVLIGMLLALLVFRVLQNKWEIGRLKKDNKRLQEELKQANIAIDRQANGQPVDQTIFVDTASTKTPSNSTLTKPSL